MSIALDVGKVLAEALNVPFGAASRARDDYDFNGLVTVGTDAALSMQFALDQGLGTGSSETMHGGWSTWPSAGTPAGFCP